MTVQPGRAAARAAAVPPPPSYPRPAVAWTTVGVLSLFYLLSLLDRLVISFLVGPIRRDLGITDFEISLLQGFGFGLFYAVFGLPVGWLVDRMSRRWIVFWGVTVWTLSTAACGLAHNFRTLLLGRIGVGAGETTLSPAAYSMIADSFPPEKLSTAMSVYSFGSLFGTCLAFTLGGAIVGLVAAHDVVMVPLLGAVRSWQLVFLVVGLPGLVLGMLIFAVPEPRRLQRAAGAGPRGTFIPFVKRNAGFLFWHHAGATLSVAGITGLMLWAPACMARSFGWAPGQIGLWLGIAGLVSGGGGALLHGRMSDRWYGRGIKDAHLRWSAACALVAAPVGVAGMLLDAPAAFLASFFLINVLVGPGMVIAATALQIVTPPSLRGRVSSIYLFLLILFGIGAGPSIVAAFTDFVFHDDARLGWSLALMCGLCFPAGAFCLWRGMPAMRRAVADLDAAGAGRPGQPGR